MSICVCSENRAPEQENRSVPVETGSSTCPCVGLGGKQVIANELVLDEVKERWSGAWSEA